MYEDKHAEQRFLRDRSGRVREITTVLFGTKTADHIHVKLESGEQVTVLKWFFGPKQASDRERDNALKDDDDLLECTTVHYTCGACEQKRMWKTPKSPAISKWLDHKIRCSKLQNKYREELGLEVVPPPTFHKIRTDKATATAPEAPAPTRHRTEKRGVYVDPTSGRILKRAVYVEIPRRRSNASDKKNRPKSSKRPVNETGAGSLEGQSSGSVLGSLTSWLISPSSQESPAERRTATG